MTYEEAELYLYRIRTLFHLYGEYKRAVDVAIEALERQVPKKPDGYPGGFYGVYPVWKYKCPCCGIDIEFMVHHCMCGQTIDWGEEL